MLHSSSFRGEGLRTPSLVPARMLSGLIPYSLCAGSHRCCEFLSVAVLSWPEDIALLCSSLTSGPYNLPTSSSDTVPEPVGRGCDTGVPLCLSAQPSLILCSLDTSFFCHPNRGNGATHSGQDLPTSVNLSKTAPHSPSPGDSTCHQVDT